MSFEWEFFESLDECVYVSDIETYDLIYMNKYLRNMFGFHSRNLYKNKKCYELLQGRKEPCPFCTNRFLKEGKFYKWNFNNPIFNKNFIVKDTLINKDGHKYRLEIGVETFDDVSEIKKEFIINSCFEKIYSSKSTEKALNEIIKFVGKTFGCDRAYIFEKCKEKNLNGIISNTYEWCEKNIPSKKDTMQNEPIETIKWCFDLFKKNSVVIIKNLEKIKMSEPVAYALFKSQNINSIAVAAIKYDNEIVGFLGIDNPKKENLKYFNKSADVITYFISSILKRRDLYKRIDYLNSHDILTGAYNRDYIWNFIDNIKCKKSLGIVCCDILGLKNINSESGYIKGDKAIIYCYNLLKCVFGKDNIFRSDSDKFVVICIDNTKDEFNEKVSSIKMVLDVSRYNMAFGTSWCNQKNKDIENQIIFAERDMFADKKKYYSNNSAKPMLSEINEKFEESFINENDVTPLFEYIKNNYYDAECFFRSISIKDMKQYIYFGDMQTNVFYISDNMKDTFGFKNNIVKDLLSIWSTKIVSEEDLQLYNQNLSELMSGKKESYDLRYRVQNRNGDIIWIHCRGIIKWDEKRTKPLFFSGCITSQEDDFVVDLLTNFPKECGAITKINDLKCCYKTIDIIGFSLNNVFEMNELKGRYISDNIIRKIAKALNEKLGNKVFFYRLDGIRFMAIIKPFIEYDIESIISELKEIVDDIYLENNILVGNPCSACVLKYPHDGVTAQDIIEKTIALISLAKNSPEKEFVVHSSQSEEKQKNYAKMTLELNKCVLNDFSDFRIVIQPIVSAKTYEIVGGETLLRWKYKQKDVSPGIFIEILEKNKSIIEVGRWIFEQAVKECKRIVSYFPDFMLTFNLSYIQLSDEGLYDFMKEILEKYGLDGKHLVMELTETHFDDMPERLKEFVKKCNSLGMKVALDDFGNGYSSLGLLLKYPANIVKLDKSLLNEITASKDKMKFIKSIVYACHQFGKKVCIEGVETQEEKELIKDADCDLIQGFYFYKPLEIKNLYDALTFKI